MCSVLLEDVVAQQTHEKAFKQPKVLAKARPFQHNDSRYSSHCVVKGFIV
jgi:hypothetical protein